MSFWGFRTYVPVAARRQQAEKEIEKLKKKGRVVTPVVIEGRKIAGSFWGKAWCDNLERYSDFANRLPRGRTYVNNGLVIDLQITRGKVEALVRGSEIYKVRIDVSVAAHARWKAICADCAGSVGSLVELLQGKLSKHVMERVCREADGLFPGPREITMTCSCPDWAGMCKHVAATLYGVGARLDSQPDHLFTLRGVTREDMISTVGADLPLSAMPTASERVLDDNDLAGLFGLEIAEPATVEQDLATAGGAESVAAQAKSNARPAQSAAPVKMKAKTKTKRQTVESSVELRADRKSPRPTPPAVTSGTQGSRKPKSISDKAPVERVSTKLKPHDVVESGGSPRKRRGAAPSARRPQLASSKQLHVGVSGAISKTR
ncbi:MAG TPA: hypothetical protein VF886_15795 [Roseiarcus sp.]